MGRIKTFFLSPYRRAAAWTLGGLLAILVGLGIWVACLAGPAAAYDVTLGLTSPFAKGMKGGETARWVGGVLGVLGWFAFPITFGIVGAEFFARRVKPVGIQLTKEQREEMIKELMKHNQEG
ncbi:hypothetical protein GCM10020229_13240 [Kitasatospora albolonga]|uniref:hypothetical protein n=1 Tax=Kitasatospora albolonga TaxID=68173 RepID=UPI0031EA59D8